MLKTPIRKKMKTWCGVSETDTKMKLLRQKNFVVTWFLSTRNEQTNAKSKCINSWSNSIQF